MTNDGWGSKWISWPTTENWVTDKLSDAAMKKANGLPNDPENTPLEEYSSVTPEMLGVKLALFQVDAWNKLAKINNVNWDLGNNTGKTIIYKDERQTELKSQGSNLVDNEAYLYFQCEGCNEILDPHTKSFKALEDVRYNAGWKVKWNLSGMGYKVYCVKCGEKV